MYLSVNRTWTRFRLESQSSTTLRDFLASVSIKCVAIKDHGPIISNFIKINYWPILLQSIFYTLGVIQQYNYEVFVES